MVYKDTGQLIPNGPMNQGGSHRGVHTTREAQNDLLVADLGPNLVNRLGDVVPMIQSGLA